MRAYGDYIRETKRLLRSYNKMKVAALNLTEEIEAMERLLADEGIASVRYGDDTTGGRGELTATEAAAARRIRIAGRIAAMKVRRDEIAATLQAIDRALSSLDEVETAAVRGHYIEGATWNDIALRLSYTEKWTKERGWKALRDVALMIFGVQMRPIQLKLYHEESP